MSSSKAQDEKGPFDLSEEPRFSYGPWLVDPPRLILLCEENGDERRLKPREMTLLVVLAREPGRVLSRNELLDTVWPDVIVGDDALTMAVSRLRKGLADGDGRSEAIETVPRVGYRLVPAPSTSGRPAPRDPAVPAEAVPAAAGGALRAQGWRRWSLAGSVLSGLVLAAGAAVVMAWPTLGPRIGAGEQPASPPAEGSGLPGDVLPVPIATLTATAGFESQGAIDPTGRSLAFVEDAPGRLGLSLLDLERREVRPLTQGPDWSPAWSPSGDTLAFMRSGDSRVSLCLVALPGGAVDCLREVAVNSNIGLDWSPDGRALVFSARSAEAEGSREGQFAIHRLELGTGAVEQITRPPAGAFGDSRPNYSPDGRSLAFTRGPGSNQHDLWVLSLETGEERTVTDHGRRIWGFDWRAGSASLVYASDHTGPYQLWEVSARGGEPQWIPTLHENVRFPRIRDELLVFDTFEVRADLVQVFPGGSSYPMEALQAKGLESAPSWSPDGRTLAFSSDRSGAAEVWLLDRWGRVRQLSRLGAARIYATAWSPDGSRLVVTADVDGEGALLALDVADGSAVPLATPGPFVHHPSVSPDGAYVVVTAAGEPLTSGAGAGNSQPELWKIPFDPSLQAQMLTDFAAAAGRFGPDGFLYAVSHQGPGLRRRAAGSETWEEVLADFLPALALAWWPRPGEIHGVHVNAQGRLEWRAWDLASGEWERIAELSGRLYPFGYALGPDAGSLLLSRFAPRESDLHSLVLPAS